MQPGDTITPGGNPEPATHLEPEVVVSLNPAAHPAIGEAYQPQESIPPPPAPIAAISDEASTAPVTQIQHDTSLPPTWQFSSEAIAGQQSSQPDALGTEVAWSASEYIVHQKNVTWFVGLGIVIAIVTIVVYLFSHDIFSPLMIALLGIGFGVFASRQPRVLDYKVNSHGINVGANFFAYENFKTFSITRDGAVSAVVLAPMQRFKTALTVYYDPQDEDKIIDVLGNYLPFTEAKPDAVDSLMRRVRF